MDKYGLIGYPLGHSFSKNYFNEKFENENIDAEYINFEIPTIDALPEVLATNPELRGLNVTIPYKEKVISFLEYKDDLEKKIEKLKNADAYKLELQQKLQSTKEQLEVLCSKANKIREKEAKRLSDDMVKALTDLNFLDVRFEIQVRNKEEFAANGADDVEFMISTNVGEGMKPMSKIASGGELSRIMLALKNVIAEKDNIHTLIFDEIDTGVSGRAAQKIGIKLRQVSKHQQVLCVTHLSQMAVMADNHLLIEKKTRDGRTYTSVHRLDFEERKGEIARIMVGENITDTALKNAEELLLSSKDI